jgi:intracellular sulfur oxidation DsrE/DsrF family protein
MMTTGLNLGAVILFLVAGGAAFAADPPAPTLGPSDKEALSGLTEVKVIFDITTGDAKKLLSRLGLIEETRDAIRQQGATPRIILAFRGPASLFIQKNPDRVKLDDLETMEKIQEKVKAMSKDKSYRLAQCAVANRYLKVKNEDTIAEVEVVGNSFISMAAFQNKGYAYLPID